VWGSIPPDMGYDMRFGQNPGLRVDLQSCHTPIQDAPWNTTVRACVTLYIYICSSKRRFNVDDVEH